MQGRTSIHHLVCRASVPCLSLWERWPSIARMERENNNHTERQQPIRETLNNSSAAGKLIFSPIRAVQKTGNTYSIPPFSEPSVGEKSLAASSCRIIQSFLRKCQATSQGNDTPRAQTLVSFSPQIPGEDLQTADHWQIYRGFLLRLRKVGYRNRWYSAL